MRGAEATPRRRRRGEVIPELTIRQQFLVKKNLGLARWTVARMRRSSPTYRRADEDDMVSAAYVGLCVAATNFDPARGVKFATYAPFWCRSFAQRATLAAGVITLPGRATHGAAKLSAKQNDRINAARTAAPQKHPLPAPPEPDGAESAEWVASALSCLAPRPRRVVEARILEGLTLREVGEELGISKERVRQLEQKALARLRQFTPAPAA